MFSDRLNIWCVQNVPVCPRHMTFIYIKETQTKQIKMISCFFYIYLRDTNMLKGTLTQYHSTRSNERYVYIG